MHSSKINETQFHYNSDMSGEIVIMVGDQEIRVKGYDLIEFVLDRLREKKIGQLEQMEIEDLERLILNAL